VNAKGSTLSVCDQPYHRNKSKAQKGEEKKFCKLCITLIFPWKSILTGAKAVEFNLSETQRKTRLKPSLIILTNGVLLNISVW